MKLGAFAVTTIALVLMTGCGAARKQQSQSELLGMQPAVPRLQEVNRPSMNEQAMATVGTAIAVSSKELVRDVIVVPGPVHIDAPYAENESYRFTLPGGSHVVTNQDRAGNRYFSSGSTILTWFYKTSSGEQVEILADYKLTPTGVLSVLWVYKGDSELLETPPLNRSYRVDSLAIPDPTSFKRELIYTGKSGNTLTTLYREYINDMARPAFSQQLQYDIGADPVIGYQGARFRIKSADNTSISYEVLSPLPNR